MKNLALAFLFIVVWIGGCAASVASPTGLSGKSVSFSGESPPVVTMRVAMDVPFQVPMLVEEDYPGRYESSWRVSLDDTNSSFDLVEISGITFTVYTDYPEAIYMGGLADNKPGGTWSLFASLMDEGDRYVLPFVFDEPMTVDDDHDFRFYLSSYINKVGKNLPNDTMYDISIDREEDIILAEEPDSCRTVEIELDDSVGQTAPTWIFKCFGGFGVAYNSPEGPATRQPNHRIATFVQGCWGKRGSISWLHENGNHITFGIKYSLREAGMETEVFLKDWYPGVTYDSEVITLPRGEGIKYVTFDFSTSELIIPAGTGGACFLVVADTTTLVGAAGDTLQVFIPGDDDAIDWGVDGYGNYNHGTILLHGGVWAGELLF